MDISEPNKIFITSESQRPHQIAKKKAAMSLSHSIYHRTVIVW